MLCLAAFFGTVGCGSQNLDGAPNDDPDSGFVLADPAKIDLACKPVQLPLDAEDCQTPLASREDLERTPRCAPDPDPGLLRASTMDRLEVLAAAVSEAVVARQDIYDRIVWDMGSMRALWPDLPFLGEYIPGYDGLLIEPDDATYDEVRAGTYDPWNCLNRLFRVTQVQFNRAIHLRFGGLYDLRALAAEYEKLPGVQRAYPNWFGGDWGELCVSPGTDEWHYIFDEASGDCPSGCIDHRYHHFVTRETGEVKRDGTWEYPSDVDPPEWFAKYFSPERCH
jgi:hypothetical protein